MKLACDVIWLLGMAGIFTGTYLAGGWWALLAVVSASVATLAVVLSYVIWVRGENNDTR